jgi:hypothetical protein
MSRRNGTSAKETRDEMTCIYSSAAFGTGICVGEYGGLVGKLKPDQNFSKR